MGVVHRSNLQARFPNLAKGFIDNYKPWETEGVPPFALPGKPLSECKRRIKNSCRSQNDCGC